MPLDERTAFDDVPDRVVRLVPGNDPPPMSPLAFSCAARWNGKPVPEREWLIRDVIPMGTVTALYGDGGNGKSLLALQLAVAVATGRPWLGLPTRPGAAMVLAAEDDPDELHRRTVTVCTAIGQELPERLYIRSAIEDGPLADLDPRKGIAANELYWQLRAAVKRLLPVLLVVDTLGCLFPGNENDRAQATAFINLLKGLAMECGSAVLLLAHPSLAGMASGTGLSGSTAWNGGVRSRLYLERVILDAHEVDPNRRLLTIKKANYGPTSGEFALRWQGGVYVPEAVETGLDRAATKSKAERVFLKLLDALMAQGRYVSASPSIAYAPTVFAKHPDAEGCTRQALTTAMEALFSRGMIVNAEHGKGTKARSHIARNGGSEHAN